MSRSVETSKAALEGYVEYHINPAIDKDNNNNNNAESVVPLLEPETNETVSVKFQSEFTDINDHSTAPAIQDPKNTIPLTTNKENKPRPSLASVSNEDNIYYFKNSPIASNTTLRHSDEVQTEDEDTIECPFIETEDLANAIKVSDIEVENDAMQFEDLPASLHNEDNVNSEVFIDAATFEFLMNQNKSNVIADSGKKSLFLKFDPLFAKRVSSDGVPAALGLIQKKQSTPAINKQDINNNAKSVVPLLESRSNETVSVKFQSKFDNNIDLSTAPPILDHKNTVPSTTNIENKPRKAESTYVHQIKPANASIGSEDNIYYIKNSPIVSSTTLRHSDEVQTEDEDTIEGPFIETEDLVDVMKVSDIEVENDAMQFEDLPASLHNEDNVNSEVFIDAATFEFLMNQNKSNVIADSGKKSLFLKFDPLFAKRVSSDGVPAALGSIQKNQSTAEKITLIPPEIVELEQTCVNPSVSSLSEESNALLYLDEIGKSPAVNSNETQKKSTSSNIKSGPLTFTSAMQVIDRLQSENTSLPDQDDLMPNIRKIHDTDIALTQLKEFIAEKESHIHNLKTETAELKARLSMLNSQTSSLENESKERLSKINVLNNHLHIKKLSNYNMAAVMEEYDKTIDTLVTDIEHERRQIAAERTKLINETDKNVTHLTSLETSFRDLHSKFETKKQMIFSMIANEDTYKKSVEESDDKILRLQNNYEQLKHTATSKLNSANQELDNINRLHDKKVAKLTAMIKCKDLHAKNLEESLAQNSKIMEQKIAQVEDLINQIEGTSSNSSQH